MKNKRIFYTVLQVLKVILIRSYIYQLFYFLLFYFSFYVRRYNFLEHFRSFIQHYLKKDFCHEFSFFIGFTQTRPTPLMAKIR